MICNYCGKPAVWCENKAVYGKNYGKSYMIWLCKPCDAYVGCHNNTKEPLGTLANRELRKRRVEVKNLFIEKKMNGEWKNKDLKVRAYAYINKLMGKSFHFGESTLEELDFIHRELTKGEKIW